jgi:guanylate kinase
VFLLPPSRLEQQRRLRGRGDAEDKVEERLRKAEEEEPVGIAMADHVVVNDDLELTLQELVRIVHHERKRRAN